MTDVVQVGTEWVPRVGMLEVPPARAALIRGLFELAAFVADHPELPLPHVSAVMLPPARELEDELRVVSEAAEALGVAAGFGADGAFVAQRSFGRAVHVKCLVRPDELVVGSHVLRGGAR